MSEVYEGRAELLHPTLYLKAAHMMTEDGAQRDVTLTIERVEKDVELTMVGGVKDFRPCVHFVETQKKAKPNMDLRLILNKTNTKTIAELYGSKVKDWNGKRITLYAGDFNGKPCIRIRNKVPPSNGKNGTASNDGQLNIEQ